MARSGKAAVLKLNKSNIRLVICADTEKGRTPYFDSKAIRLVEDGSKDVFRTAPKPVQAGTFVNLTQQKSSVSQPKQAPKYHFQKLGSDVKVLEEMMFGTGVIAFKGLTVKVHLLRSPPQLLVSNVFIPEKLSRDSTLDIESDSSGLAGLSADFSSRESNLSMSKEKYGRHNQPQPILAVCDSLESLCSVVCRCFLNYRHPYCFIKKQCKAVCCQIARSCVSNAGLRTASVTPLPQRRHSYCFISRSFPVDVPVKDLQPDYNTDDDNGLAYFTSSGSFRTSFTSSGSISSYSSLHRRWMRAHRTSLDGQHRKDSGFICEGSLNRPRRIKLAIGIIFESQDEKDEESNELFQNFFFSHFALIEGHVEKLRSVVEKAFFNSGNFLPTVMEALDAFRSDIYDLYMAARLSEPVWLTMTSAATYKTKLCEKFMDAFVSLVTKYDNKKHKFFVSSLLSAVLTNHLAWVATVTPANGIQSSTYLDKHTAKWVDALTKSHPYNPLWAQLGDLFGAIGFPRKISRTIIIGKKADIVKQFLFVLSYFIRCSEVRENTDLQCLTNIVSDMKFELSSSSSDKTLTNGWGENCTSSVVAVFTPKQANNDSVNEFDSKINSHSEMTKLVGKHAEYGNDDFKCVTNSTAASIEESSVEIQTHDNFKISYNSSNGTCFDGSCDHKLINSICDIDQKFEHSLRNGDYHKLVDKSISNALCKNYQECNLNNSIILPVKSNTVGKTVDFNTNKTSSVNCPIEIMPSGFSTAAELTGMSDLYIFAPDNSPGKQTSAEILPSHTETTCLGTAAAGTKNFATESPETGGESFLNSQPVNEVKVKSRLTQQLDEGIHYSRVGDNKVMSSAGSLLLHPLEVKRAVDSTSKLKISDHANLSGKAAAQNKNRSVTPIEFNRRRHLSSSGSIEYEVLDPTLHCKEVRLPDSMQENGQWHVQAFDRNIGHSLLADYTDHYMADFVLHGTSDTNYRSRLLNDLQMSVRHSVLDEPINEAVCVIADTDNWTVEVASSKVISMSTSGCTMWNSSHLVADLIASVVDVFKLKMSAEFCLMHLEDRLQDIYFKSVVLSENMRTTTIYSQQELTHILGWDSSDLPLLLAVAGTHAPAVSHEIQ